MFQNTGYEVSDTPFLKLGIKPRVEGPVRPVLFLWQAIPIRGVYIIGCQNSQVSQLGELGTEQLLLLHA